MTVIMVYIIFCTNKSENKILKSHRPVVLLLQKVTGQLSTDQLTTGQLSTCQLSTGQLSAHPLYYTSNFHPLQPLWKSPPSYHSSLPQNSRLHLVLIWMPWLESDAKGSSFEHMPSELLFTFPASYQVNSVITRNVIVVITSFSASCPPSIFIPIILFTWNTTELQDTYGK